MYLDEICNVKKCHLNQVSGLINKFDLPSDYVIFFQNNENKELDSFVAQHFTEIRNQFYNIGLNFLYLPQIRFQTAAISQVLDYFLPQLDADLIVNYLNDLNCETLSAIPNSSFAAYQRVLDALNFKSENEYGLLFMRPYPYVIGSTIASEKQENFLAFFEKAITIAEPKIKEYVQEFYESDFLFEPHKDYSELLDPETMGIVKAFEAKLEEVKNSGQLLFLLPILKEVIEKHSLNVDINSISKIFVDSEYKIFLPYFKRKIEMSHLTKSIYLLFLKHPEGIALKKLTEYQQELFSIYKNVSYQHNYDKMLTSIEDVLNIKTKAIYTHLSRIKSAFYKVMDENLANNYVVSGSGEELRKVYAAKFVEWSDLYVFE